MTTCVELEKVMKPCVQEQHVSRLGFVFSATEREGSLKQNRAILELCCCLWRVCGVLRESEDSVFNVLGSMYAVVLM